MVIHTKERTKLHTHEPKQASIKGSNIYTVDRNPMKKSAESGSHRKSTVHQVKREGKIAKYKSKMQNANQSIKVKNTSLRNAGMVGGKTVTDQMEGGQEIQQSAMLMYEASKPISGTVSRGAELFKRQFIAKQKIKKVEAGKNIAKKGAKKTAKKGVKDTAKKAAKETAKTAAKETAKIAAKTATTVATTTAGTALAPGAGTAIGYAAGELVGAKIEYQDMVNDNWARKIKFFLDKMKAEGEQTDSFGKLVKDLIFRRAGMVMKQIMAIVAPFLLVLVLLVAMIAVPVVAVVGVIYNSPFAIFFPPLEDGETVTTVASAYVAGFNREVSDLANAHDGCDEGQIVYVGYEGADVPNNYYDILAVYMV